MTPYFERDGVRLYHAPCLEVMATMAPRSAEVSITDPPYTKSTHKGARTNKGRRGKSGERGTCPTLIDFEHIEADALRATFDALGRVVSRWIVGTVAYQHAARMEEEPPNGLRFVRCGVWTKVAPTPQMTGDRPATGWEAVALLHAEDRKLHWNGGGRPAVWHCQAEMRGEYPTQKPEPLISQFISDFADPGDTILDPFSGGGTTLVCAWKAGHPAIGCDIREEACEVAARRLERVMAQGRIDLPRRVKAVQPRQPRLF